MSQICYMSGYGVSVDSLYPLLKEEFQDLSAYEIIDEISDLLFCSFSGEEDYIYIPNVAPYEKAPFENVEDIDKYFYDKLKPFLKEEVDYSQLRTLLDNVFDWIYC